MKIIIAGAGEVGFHLAKQLVHEHHDITVIEPVESRLERINSTVEIFPVLGKSTVIEKLKEADAKHCDLLLAVNESEAENITTAILAKKLGVKTTVVRVENDEYVNPQNSELFKSIGVDHLVYPEELAAMEIVKLIERAAATDVIEFEDGKLIILGIRIGYDSPTINKTIKQTAEEFHIIDFRIVAIHRGLNTVIPKGEDTFMPEDQIFIITKPDAVEKIVRLSGQELVKMKNIMILGGGKIGRLTAHYLEKQYNVKLIESNKDKTHLLVDYLDETMVIQGDGRDIDLLAQEGIIDMDGFIAVTDDAETNIITCLMAKHLKVKKMIALVDNVDYIPLTQTIGLDALINKKLIAANNITKAIRKRNLVANINILGIDAEVLEYSASEKSKIVKKKIKNLDFPDNAIIGGYIRNEDAYIAVGETQIQPNDKVVVFALPGAINKIESFFV
ncbi:portal protein [bacterium BRH_c32]|nr:MAG: portal protein [bacterium BRH_c32]